MESDAIRIRPMTAEDYGAARLLWSRTPGMGLRSLDDSREGIARFLARNPDTCFTAWAGERLAGTILCGCDGRRAYIYHLAVAPEHRRKGLGRGLAEAALGAARAAGIHKAALVAFADNAPGNAFWDAMGFARRADLTYRDLSLNDENR